MALLYHDNAGSRWLGRKSEHDLLAGLELDTCRWSFAVQNKTKMNSNPVERLAGRRLSVPLIVEVMCPEERETEAEATHEEEHGYG